MSNEAPDLSGIDLSTIAEMSPEEMLSVMGVKDMVINDDNPFGELQPQWERFARHTMANFDPSTLPMWARGFTPAARALLVAKMAKDPVGARDWVLAMIEMAVRDLAIDFTELEEAWKVTAIAHTGDYDPTYAIGAPLPADE